MTPQTPVLRTPTLLRRLSEYATLLESCRPDTRRNCGLPPSVSDQLAHYESILPNGLVDYIKWLFNCPLQTGKKLVTTLTVKGRCATCLAPVHPEWVETVAHAEIIFLCGSCWAVFVPNSQTTEMPA